MDEPRTLRTGIKPLCPRDNNVMKFEKNGVRWKDEEGVAQSLSTYYCGDHGCSVRYNSRDGYFSVVDEPDIPFFLEEPAANIFRCPLHNTWLYRCQGERGSFDWRCAVANCDYVHGNAHGTWLRQ